MRPHEEGTDGTVSHHHDDHLQKRNELGKDIRGKDVIGKEHEMYALTYGMMIGVQYDQYPQTMRMTLNYKIGA